MSPRQSQDNFYVTLSTIVVIHLIGELVPPPVNNNNTGVKIREFAENLKNNGGFPMNHDYLINTISGIALLLVAGTAQAALIGRLETSPGSGVFQAYYDDQLGITWAQNADTANGALLYANANDFVSNYSIDGIDEWRLPSADVNGDTTIENCATAMEAACKDNEMGYMFYYNIGADQFTNPFVTGDPAVLALFPEFMANFYWSGTVVSATTAAHFNFNNGSNGESSFLLNSALFIWAVHDGDVGAIPLPAAVWLFVSGLAGLIGVCRYRMAT